MALWAGRGRGVADGRNGFSAVRPRPQVLDRSALLRSCLLAGALSALVSIAGSWLWPVEPGVGWFGRCFVIGVACGTIAPFWVCRGESRR